MARLEGDKPNTRALIIGAVVFALVAGGLFLAFRGVPNSADNAPTNADANSTDTASSDGNAPTQRRARRC